MTDQPKTPTLADLSEQARVAAETLKDTAADLRQSLREIYQIFGMPVPASLKDPE